MVDIAHGDEGWTSCSAQDPLALTRITKKNTLVPFVP